MTISDTSTVITDQLQHYTTCKRHDITVLLNTQAATLTYSAAAYLLSNIYQYEDYIRSWCVQGHQQAVCNHANLNFRAIHKYAVSKAVACSRLSTLAVCNLLLNHFTYKLIFYMAKSDARTFLKDQLQHYTTCKRHNMTEILITQATTLN